MMISEAEPDPNDFLKPNVCVCVLISAHTIC